MRRILKYSIVALATLILGACNGDLSEFSNVREPQIVNPGGRVESNDVRHVLLLYSAGYTSLSSFLTEDIEDLMGGYLPPVRGNRSDNVFLILSHLTAGTYNYRDTTCCYLIQVGMRDDQPVMDTLITYPKGMMATTKSSFQTIMTDVKNLFPAKGYGMIISCHGTGWLPPGYYDSTYPVVTKSADGTRPASGTPVLYSIGNEQYEEPGSTNFNPKYKYHEIDLKDFEEALPMKLDYLLFDACLMGGIEVAYELKDKVGMMGFSQTEVMAEGYDYRTIASRLIEGPEPDPKGCCEDFYQQYVGLDGKAKDVTTSFVDCSKLEPLAEVCRELFEAHRDGLAHLSDFDVQGYFRSGKHWFYDLRDMIAKSGATAEELARLDEALDGCILYKAAAPNFLSIPIHTHSGFSTYMPSEGNSTLNEYYKTLRWNQATELVK